MSTQELERVRDDFDRIARLMASRPEQPEPYDRFLRAQVPGSCGRLLEVGCGSGRMARLLTAHARHVTAIDASPQMIELARARSRAFATLELVCADFMTYPFAEAQFDCVFTVTTLHHMAHAPALERMKTLLVSGGTLVIHDVRAVAGAGDWLTSGMRAVATGEVAHWMVQRARNRGELARAWRDHGATDTYLDMNGVRALADAHLPGTTVFNHALWRYTIVWRKTLQRSR
jgi:SAM-dependent methyltransferase